jgi:hypothetical protein
MVQAWDFVDAYARWQRGEEARAIRIDRIDSIYFGKRVDPRIQCVCAENYDYDWVAASISADRRSRPVIASRPVCLLHSLVPVDVASPSQCSSRSRQQSLFHRLASSSSLSSGVA